MYFLYNTYLYCNSCIKIEIIFGKRIVYVINMNFYYNTGRGKIYKEDKPNKHRYWRSLNANLEKGMLR